MKNGFVVIAIVSVLCAGGYAHAQQCSTDGDCSEGLCYASSCTQITEFESLLSVELEQFVGGATVYIDDIYMGEVPWEGIVSAGNHQIRVEAQGYQTAQFNGSNRAGGRETIRVKLLPMVQQQLTSGPQSPYANQPEAPFVPKRFFAGIALSGGLDTAQWGDETRRPAWMARIGLLVGARLTRDTSKVWFDLGLRLDYGAMIIKSWPWKPIDRQDDKQDWVPGGPITQYHMLIGLVPRLMFPVKKGKFYLGAEAEVAVAISSWTWGYLAMRGDMSFIVNEWLELQINPIGIEYFQELYLHGMIIGYNMSAGIVVRFP